MATAPAGGGLATAALRPRMQLTDVGSGEAAPGGPSVDLLGVLAAQVLAHVSGGAPVPQCAHAPCGRWFSHQLGHARYGQRRSRGVLYCTDRCAGAAAQQRYLQRQRQRAARRGQPVD